MTAAHSCLMLLERNQDHQSSLPVLTEPARKGWIWGLRLCNWLKHVCPMRFQVIGPKLRDAMLILACRSLDRMSDAWVSPLMTLNCGSTSHSIRNWPKISTNRFLYWCRPSRSLVLPVCRLVVWLESDCSWWDLKPVWCFLSDCLLWLVALWLAETPPAPEQLAGESDKVITCRLTCLCGPGPPQTQSPVILSRPQ